MFAPAQIKVANFNIFTVIEDSINLAIIDHALRIIDELLYKYRALLGYFL